MVEVEGVTRGTTRGSGPGQRSGEPAVVVAYRVTNRSAEDVDLSGALVDLSHGPEQHPATPDEGDGVRPLPDRLPAGAQASATAVFGVPAGTREVRVVVRLRGGTPPAVFSAELP